MAGPPKYLTQEGGLVGSGQRELPITQLLAQAAMQQAQHHVIGGTGSLGRSDTLWLCPTHIPLSTQDLLLPGVPRLCPSQPGPPAAPAPSPLCSFADSSALCALIPLGWLALQAQDSPTSGKQEEEHLELLALREQSHEVKTERDLVDTGVSSLVQPWEGGG